jgi:hypothetical protein
VRPRPQHPAPPTAAPPGLPPGGGVLKWALIAVGGIALIIVVSLLSRCGGSEPVTEPSSDPPTVAAPPAVAPPTREEAITACDDLGRLHFLGGWEPAWGADAGSQVLRDDGTWLLKASVTVDANGAQRGTAFDCVVGGEEGSPEVLSMEVYGLLDWPAESTVYSSAPTPAPEPEPEPTAEPTPEPEPEPTAAETRAPPPPPDPEPAPDPEPYYKNCDEAREAGVAPIYRGQPGYRPGLDRDNDGVACET